MSDKVSCTACSKGQSGDSPGRCGTPSGCGMHRGPGGESKRTRAGVLQAANAFPLCSEDVAHRQPSPG